MTTKRWFPVPLFVLGSLGWAVSDSHLNRAFSVTDQPSSQSAPVPEDWSLLVFRSKGCPPCDVLEKTTLADERVRSALKGVRIEIVPVEEQPGRAVHYLSTAFPRMVFVKDGHPEDFLVGAVPPDLFIAEWNRIRNAGPATVESCVRRVRQYPTNASCRADLGIKLAMLGDVEGARLQLSCLVHSSSREPKQEDRLRGTIDTAIYATLREATIRARDHGEIPSIYELRGFVGREDVIADTRYHAARMLIGSITERIDREREPSRLGDLVELRRKAYAIAWSTAPRPLAVEEWPFAREAASALWKERLQLQPSDCHLALSIADEVLALNPEDPETQTVMARALWLGGDHERALGIARKVVGSPVLRELEELAPPTPNKQ